MTEEQIKKSLHQVLEGLPEDLLIIANLLFIDRLTPREIAQKLNRSLEEVIMDIRIIHANIAKWLEKKDKKTSKG